MCSLLTSFLIYNMIAFGNSGIVVDFGKKSTLKKHLSKEKKAFLANKAPILQTKSSFGAEKKHLVNIILLTKSNNDGEKKFYFHPNFF